MTLQGTFGRMGCVLAMVASAAVTHAQASATTGANPPSSTSGDAEDQARAFETLIGVVDALAAEGRYDEASDKLVAAGKDQAVLAASPSVGPALLAKQAELLERQGQYEPAREKLEAARVLSASLMGAHHPLVASYVASQAELDARFGQSARAIQTLREAARLERARLPWDYARIVTVLRRLADLQSQAGQHDAAIRTYREAVDMLGQSGATVPAWVWSSVHQSFGKLLVDRGQPDRAVALIEQWIEQWKPFGEQAQQAIASAQLDLATIQLRAGRPEEAMNSVIASRQTMGVEQADDWRPVSPALDLSAARLLRRLGRFDAALTLLAGNQTALTQMPAEQAEAMGLTPRWLDAERVLTLTAAGRYQDAADALNVLYDQLPDDGLAIDRWVALGRVGQREFADQALRTHRQQRAASDPANDPTALLIDILLEKSDPRQITSVGQTWPSERRLDYLCTAFYYLGQRAAIAGNTAQARDQFSRAVRTGRTDNPAHELSQRELERLAQN